MTGGYTVTNRIYLFISKEGVTVLLLALLVEWHIYVKGQAKNIQIKT